MRRGFQYDDVFMKRIQICKIHYGCIYVIINDTHERKTSASSDQCWRAYHRVINTTSTFVLGSATILITECENVVIAISAGELYIITHSLFSIYG